MNEKNFTIKFNIPALKIDYLSANWEKEIARNDNFKLYEGNYEGIGPCTILILRNIEKHMDEFISMVNYINIYAQMNFMYIAKLYGFIKDKDKKVDDKLSKITIKEYIETHDGVEKYAEIIEKKTKKDIKVK